MKNTEATYFDAKGTRRVLETAASLRTAAAKWAHYALEAGRIETTAHFARLAARCAFAAVPSLRGEIRVECDGRHTAPVAFPAMRFFS